MKTRRKVAIFIFRNFKIIETVTLKIIGIKMQIANNNNITGLPSSKNIQIPKSNLFQNQSCQKDIFIKRSLNFTANTQKLTEMSRYIDISAYDKLENFHAGWQDSVNKIKELISKRFNAPKIMEHGSGTGNSTELFAQIPNSQIDAIELDSECYDKLLLNMKNNPNVKCINGSSLDYNPNKKCDSVVAMFSLTHLDENNMKVFLSNCREKYLNSNGTLVVGDEFLPRHNVNTNLSRINALAKHHNNVIAKAILDGKPELARLELDAMISGYEKEGDFKVSCSEFERRLSEAGFKFKKYKIYPNKRDFALLKPQNTGVYVYEAKLK